MIIFPSPPATVQPSSATQSSISGRCTFTSSRTLGKWRMPIWFMLRTSCIESSSAATSPPSSATFWRLRALMVSTMAPSRSAGSSLFVYVFRVTSYVGRSTGFAMTLLHDPKWVGDRSTGFMIRRLHGAPSTHSCTVVETTRSTACILSSGHLSSPSF